MPRGPYIILSNHQTTMDPFMLSLSFKFPIYFVASDDIFNLKVSPLINYLVAPIPKSKSYKDIAAVKSIFRVLKEGGAVGIFPEGNRTISGGQWEISEAAAKLAKSAKVPLVLYNISGGYGTDPRWGHSVRKGKCRGFVRKVLSAEELSELTVGRLSDIIRAELTVDDTLLNIPFKSRRRAEFIERALYICPHCNSVSSIRSEGSRFFCQVCGIKAEYTKDLHIFPPTENGFARIYEWYEWQRGKIAEYVQSGATVSDSGVLFRESIKFRRKKKFEGDCVSIDKDNLTVSGKGVKKVYPLKDILAVTMVGKKKFNFYYDNKILQIKGNKRFCAIKYVHIFDGLRQELPEESER